MLIRVDRPKDIQNFIKFSKHVDWNMEEWDHEILYHQKVEVLDHLDLVVLMHWRYWKRIVTKDFYYSSFVLLEFVDGGFKIHLRFIAWWFDVQLMIPWMWSHFRWTSWTTFVNWGFLPRDEKSSPLATWIPC